LKSEVFSLGC